MLERHPANAFAVGVQSLESPELLPVEASALDDCWLRPSSAICAPVAQISGRLGCLPDPWRVPSNTPCMTRAGARSKSSDNPRPKWSPTRQLFSLRWLIRGRLVGNGSINSTSGRFRRGRRACDRRSRRVTTLRIYLVWLRSSRRPVCPRGTRHSRRFSEEAHMATRHDAKERRHYAEMTKSVPIADVARIAGVQVPTVRGWCREFGISDSRGASPEVARTAAQSASAYAQEFENTARTGAAAAEEDTADDVQRAVDAYVAEYRPWFEDEARRQADLDGLRGVIADWEREHGALTKSEKRAARARRRK